VLLVLAEVALDNDDVVPSVNKRVIFVIQI
jgi:hypothetical protein